WDNKNTYNRASGNKIKIEDSTINIGGDRVTQPWKPDQTRRNRQAGATNAARQGNDFRGRAATGQTKPTASSLQQQLGGGRTKTNALSGTGGGNQERQASTRGGQSLGKPSKTKQQPARSGAGGNQQQKRVGNQQQKIGNQQQKIGGNQQQRVGNQKQK